MPTTIENRVLKKYSGNDSGVTIPEGVTEIGGWACFWSPRLSQINIPDSVTKISYAAFKSCWSLSQINIPEGVTEIGR